MKWLVAMNVIAAVWAGGALARAGPGDMPIPSAPDAVIDEVRSRNRDLAAADAAVEAAGHVAPQASSFPDPVLQATLSNFPLSTLQTPMTGLQVELRQTLPWFKTLDALQRAARRDVEAGRLDRLGLENALVARARALLWQLAFLEARRELALDIAGVLDRVAETARSAYEVGRGRQQDLIRPSVEGKRIAEEVLGIDADITRVRSRINALRDRPPAAPVTPWALALDVPEVAPLDAEALAAFAIETNPRLAARAEAVAGSAQRVQAAREDLVPDFMVGIQYRFRWIDAASDAVNGSDFIGLSVGVSLPVFAGTKQHEKVREAKARRRGMEHLARGAAIEIRDAVAGLVADIDSNLERARLLRDGILPDQEAALESSLNDYRTGAMELLSVLDNLETLYAARVDLARRAFQVRAALAELEGWLGAPLEEARRATRGEPVPAAGREHEQ